MSRGPVPVIAMAAGIVECEACSRNPGSPQLCIRCLHNRGRATEMVEQLNAPLWKIAVGRMAGWYAALFARKVLQRRPPGERDGHKER